MIKESRRSRHLESAGLKTAIFALISAILSAISGFYLYKIIMDALPDNTLEVYYSFLKPIHLGSITINTAQQTMALAIILFIIPFWLLISFLVKRHALVNGDTVGTGLYWLLVLGGLIGILYFLGIWEKLINLNFSNLTSIKTDLPNLIGAVLSLILLILAIWTIINIAMAERSPVEYDDEYDDIEDDAAVVEKTVKVKKTRRTTNHPEDVVEEEKTVAVIEPEADAVVSPAAYGYDDEPVVKKPISRKVTRIVKTNAPVEKEPVKVTPANNDTIAEPKIVRPTMISDNAESSNKNRIITPAPVVEPIISEEEFDNAVNNVTESEIKEVSAEDTTVEHSNIVANDEDEPIVIASPSDYEAAVNPEALPKKSEMSDEETPIFTTDFMDHDEDVIDNVTVNEEPSTFDVVDEPINTTVPYDDSNAVESAGTLKEEEIKVTRRYIEMPGEDKVIVVTREYDGSGRLLDEKTEVKNKKDVNL